MKPEVVVCDRCSAERRSDNVTRGYGNWRQFKVNSQFSCITLRTYDDGSIAPVDLCPECYEAFEKWWGERGATA